jgi:phosphoglycolate phosphatase-like HAD superfamily hydrolase
MPFTRLRIGGRPVYVDSTARPELRSLRSIVFDCDGVLIDTRASYDRAIQQTVAYLARRLLGFTVPASFAGPRIIYAFRSGGGFNNDWDTTYAILLFALARCSRTYLTAWTRASSPFVDGAHDLTARLKAVEQCVQALPLPGLASRQVQAELLAFAQAADVTGATYVERNLLAKGKIPKEVWAALTCLKALLGYPGRPGTSLLATVFCELFYGRRLYRAVYRLTPQFGFAHGTVEAERPIVRAPTLRRLHRLLGGAQFGIASGRASGSAAQTLGPLLDYFAPPARVFIEDLAVNGTGPRFEEVVKPHPYALLKAAARWHDGAPVLYVGDSAEDLLMAQRANQTEPRFLFAGVYASGFGGEERIVQFQQRGAQLILPSVNDLPAVLAAVRG